MTEKNFEKSIERLEAVVSRMESGELTLDEALAHYEEGIKLSRFCYQKLTEAEKKIEKLVKKKESGDDAYTTEPLELFPKNDEQA